MFISIARGLCVFAALSGTTASLALRASAQVPGPNAPPGGDVAEAASGPADPAEPPGYRAAIDGAISEYEAGRFTEARALFERAHSLFPNARALRGLGMAEFELRNYPASLYFLEQALAAPAKPLTPELRAETEALIARTRSFVGRVVFGLEPANAALVLNGTRVSLGPDRALTLSVGDYMLQASAPGYDSEQQALRVAGGQDQRVVIALAKHVDVLAAAPLAAPAERRESLLESPWLWAVAGVAVAAASVGLGFAIAGSDPKPVAPSGGSSGVVLDGPP